MGFVILLVDCFFAPRAFLVILAIGALSHEVISESTNFNGLSTFSTDREHRAGIEIVHIFVILLGKALIYSFAKLAMLFLVNHVYIFIHFFLRNLYKLIASLELFLVLIFFHV